MPGSKSTHGRQIFASMSAALLVVVVVLTAIVPTVAQSSGTWAATGSLNFPRIGHTATLLANGQVLVAGGEDSQGNHIAAAELYNPATGANAPNLLPGSANYPVTAPSILVDLT